MTLKIQIYSSVFSALFGILFSVSMNYCYKKVRIKNRYGRIAFNLFFVLIHVIGYYMILEKINNGILHPYCILSVLAGFIIAEILHYKVANKLHI